MTKAGYCANLGHKNDDESGLIYMAARYMEPSTGRFLSEDPDRLRHNWYAYCSSNPVTRIDPTGKGDSDLADYVGVAVVTWLITFLWRQANQYLDPLLKAAVLKVATATAAVAGSYLINLGLGLIMAGKANFDAAAAAIEAASLSEGLPLAFGASVTGISDGLLGAAQLSLGVTLLACGEFLFGLSEDAGT